MKRTILLVSGLVLLLNTQLLSQSDAMMEFEFLPPGLHFAPLKANMREPRVGVLYFPSNANLKVDIGNSIDLLKFKFPDIESRLTFGIDFMAYAQATSYSGNRLQIGALDGFFGGNASFSKDLTDNKLISRFRIIHNSAHLADGKYDLEKDQWIDGKYPIPFTKDFGELTIGYITKPGKLIFRTYGSLSYSTLIRPPSLKKWAFNGGFEVATDKLINTLFDKSVYTYTAYHIDLMGLPEYAGNNHLMFGIKFGDWEGKGVSLYLSYYAGNHFFSEYYYKRIEKFGIGFFVDFI